MASAFWVASGHDLGRREGREEGVGSPCNNYRHNCCSVILPDIAIGFIEEVLISVQLVLQECSPQFLLHQAFAL